MAFRSTNKSSPPDPLFTTVFPSKMFLSEAFKNKGHHRLAFCLAHRTFKSESLSLFNKCEFSHINPYFRHWLESRRSSSPGFLSLGASNGQEKRSHSRQDEAFWSLDFTGSLKGRGASIQVSFCIRLLLSFAFPSGS